MLAAALQVPAYPQSSNRKEIPFENSRMFGLVLVKVEVNGRPAVLIVDTASNHTIVRSGFAGASLHQGHAESGPITWRDHKRSAGHGPFQQVRTRGG